MHASTALLFACSAAAALFASAHSKPLTARQGIVLPPNTTLHTGPLIDLEGAAADGLRLCPGPITTSPAVVAINPLVWGSGSFCGGNAGIWYNGQSFNATVIAECTECGNNGIGLYPAFYAEVTGNAVAVTGEWAVDGQDEIHTR